MKDDYTERRIAAEVGKIRNALKFHTAQEMEAFRFTCTTTLRDTIKTLEERVARLERIIADDARGKK